MEQRINESAEAMANDFMAKQSSQATSETRLDDDNSQPATPSVSKDQARLVYKFLNTPHELLVAGMSQMQPN